MNETDCLHPNMNYQNGNFCHPSNNKDYFLEEIDPDNLNSSIPKDKLKFKRVLRELFSFLYNDNGNLWRTANLLHVFGSITALCCVDKKGLLSWPNPTADKIFFLTAPNQPQGQRAKDGSEQTDEHATEDAPTGSLVDAHENEKRDCIFCKLSLLL